MSSSTRYFYGYQLDQEKRQYNHGNGVLPPCQRIGVNSDFRFRYILKKRNCLGHDEEIIASIRKSFFVPWRLVIRMEDYLEQTYRYVEQRLGPFSEQCSHATRERIRYTYDRPENFLDRFFWHHGMCDDDARGRLKRQIEDFAYQLKRDPSNAGRTEFSIVVSINIYTVQQENETIDAAKERAIIPDPLQVGRSDKLVELLKLPPMAYIHKLEGCPASKIKNVVVTEYDDSVQECCICLNRPSAGEEISVLPCSHTYHSTCVTKWLKNCKMCPLCRSPVNLCVLCYKPVGRDAIFAV